jgi:S1-C subfamily serine protease
MNPKDRVGIHLSDAVGMIAGQMKQITVKVRGSRGWQGSGTVWPLTGLIITNAHVADAPLHDVEFSDGLRIPGRLVADIRLAPGYSGGPLADATGAIVGINSMIIDGLGCAVTSDTVDRFLRRFHPTEAA